MTKTENFDERPPANALRVQAWRDLPRDRGAARYKITRADGDFHLITLSKGNRIVLDALILQPLFCASPVRISDRVCILRHDYNVPIIKRMYGNDAATDRAKFGVYFLAAKVVRLGNDGGAA
ncbi:MAG: hypothetical protein RID15_04010 [Marinovum algicola]|uniref:Uncharacterized protein n=1 Tax=Marinovum algicola TaxID=42444 RepID=A0A975ZMK8_9RHOB|nr:hypothetical protein [Marinovum algicola]SEJ04583.1 hypothetical protein SAMN04487940_10353 [Marinovum algicola]SLN18631.1 hypothetical protein MAA5396_00565 [Marinovum algicola]